MNQSRTLTESRSVTKLFDLSDRVALVTGGAGWLGSAISEALIEQGAQIVVASRNLDACTKFVSNMKDKHPGINKISAQQLDITDDESVQKCFSQIKENCGRLDILVNNAFSGKQSKFSDTTSEQWDELFGSTLTGYFRCTKEAVKLMEAQGSGSIINLSSMYGIVSPDPAAYDGTEFISSPAYGAAKAGVIQLTKYVACFYGKFGIRANAISPGPFPQDSVQESKAFADKLSSKTAFGRLGRPDELKGAIAFLASDASSYVTGHNLVVDGGWTAR